MQSNKHLLVIRLSAMGDVAMSVPILAGLSQQYPGVKITILTRGFFTPLFSQIPNVTIFEADVSGKHKGVLGLYKLFKELKQLNITAVADLHNVLRSNVLKLFFKSSRIPFVQINKGRKEKKQLTATTNKKFYQLQTTHERYAVVFAKLGFPIVLEKIALPSKKEISVNTQKFISNDTKKWIGIAPFAAFSGKMYPLKNMEQVGAKLNNTNKYKVILFGGPDDKVLLQKWESSYTHAINIAGKISFNEELSLISQLDIMVAMDSGNAHLASIFGIPTITLWGVTHPYAGFYPFRQSMDNAILADRKEFPLIPTSVYGNKFPEGYENVMNTITTDSILKKIDNLLS